MGISEMTHVSYFFAAMAVVFGGVSIIMYFTFDIRRCWKIVRGREFVPVREQVSNTGKKGGSQIYEKTEQLAPDRTETLFQFEETAPLETMALVQDIVMMDLAKDCRLGSEPI